MILQTHAEVETKRPDTAGPRPASQAHPVLNVAALGCLVAGAVAIIRAVEMERVGDGLLCVVSALAACSLVCYLYFRKG